MLSLYFVKCAGADNYIMADNELGVRCSNCATDGKWGGIDINARGDDGEQIPGEMMAAMLNEVSCYMDESDLAWMGDPVYDTMQEWRDEQAKREHWQQDEAFLIGHYYEDAYDEQFNEGYMTAESDMLSDFAEEDEQRRAEGSAENRYTVEYTNIYGDKVSTIVWAMTAEDAAERVADKLEYRYSTSLVDADTRGTEWATGHFNMPNFGYCEATRIKDEGLPVTEAQLALAITEAPNYTDPDAYVSDLLLSAAFLPLEDEDAQPDMTQSHTLRTIWTVVAAPFRDFLAAMGVGQSALSRQHHIPLRTVQNWAIGATSCPIYVRILLAQAHGIWPC